MSKVSKSNAKTKHENEIQSYINSFKEIEETEDNPTASGSNEKVFITSDQNYEQIDDENDEYKYVFIVQDEEEDGGDDKVIEEDDGDEDNQVYEFEDYEDEEALDEVDDKPKPPKTSNAKKSTSSTSHVVDTVVHMCSYCNYSTGKRYLLARHMKCHSEDRPHKCNVCERGFKTIASLTNHVNTHTGIKVI
jgi:uncharacterized Zn-finger protein